MDDRNAAETDAVRSAEMEEDVDWQVSCPPSPPSPSSWDGGGEYDGPGAVAIEVELRRLTAAESLLDQRWP
jgi:hypothetical protein